MSSEKKLNAYEILSSFFDEGTFTETDAFLKGASGQAEAVTGYGFVDDLPVYAFAQNTAVAGGAMSKAQAKKITKLFDRALKTGAPVVGFYDSIGGRLDEKFDLLAAYGDILRESARLSGVVPQISVILGDCFGASALTAACADFVIMTAKARLSADPADKDSSAQANICAGTAQFVEDDCEKALSCTRKLISYLPSNNLETPPAFESLPPYENPDRLPKYIADADTLLCVGSKEGICTAFGRVDGNPAGFIVTHGEDIGADDARRIAEHVRFCDAFSIPLITLVDAGRFDCLSDTASLVSAYAEATTAKISVISGTAVGAVYTALAGTASGADTVLALPDAVVSPIMPAAAAYIMDDSIADLPYADQSAAIDGYIRENLTAEKAAEDGYIDDIVSVEQLRARIISELNMLSSKRVPTLPKKHTTNV